MIFRRVFGSAANWKATCAPVASSIQVSLTLCTLSRIIMMGAWSPVPTPLHRVDISRSSVLHFVR
jgi:hypothetical protein